jgi:hypothetical protein
MQIEVIQQLDNSTVQPRAQGQPVERQLGRSSSSHPMRRLFESCLLWA